MNVVLCNVCIKTSETNKTICVFVLSIIQVNVHLANPAAFQTSTKADRDVWGKAYFTVKTEAKMDTGNAGPTAPGGPARSPKNNEK